jgi:hypothetical protein
MRRFFIAGVVGLALASGIGAASAGVSSAQTVSQACTTSGYNGYYSGLQATCQVTASTQLSPPNTVFVLPVNSTAAPISCQGANGGSFTTQGTVGAAPANLYAYNAGQPVCQFTVTSGYAPAGSLLGTEVVSVPNPASGGTVQLSAYLCGDPSCASGTLNPYGPPAPPTLVTISNNGTNYYPYNQYNPSYQYYPTVTVPATNSDPDYNPAWNTTPNPCFHAAGSADPCQHPDQHHHGNGDGNGGDSDGDGS